MSKGLTTGAQKISPGAQQFLVGAVQGIILNTVTRWHYHINLVEDLYQSIGGVSKWS